jgi:uncharacterized membrane protein
LPTIPDETILVEPDIGSTYGNGWRQLWEKFLELLLVVIIMWVISIPFSVLSWTTDNNVVVSTLGTIYSILLSLPVTWGVYYCALRAARGEDIEVKDMFAGFNNYGNVVAGAILQAIIIAVGFIFLIVPGIIFACKLAFVPYLVVDEKMDAIAAIKKSWKMTDGHSPTIFFMGLLSIPIMILGVMLFGVCVIPAWMWITVSFASMYHAVKLTDGASVLPQTPIVGG